MPPKTTRVGKEYKKLGQTKDTPPPRDSLRVFYTSLYKQNRNSYMAMKWCLERGLLTDKQTRNVLLSMNVEKSLHIKD
jgi:hypothetical protein